MNSMVDLSIVFCKRLPGRVFLNVFIDMGWWDDGIASSFSDGFSGTQINTITLWWTNIAMEITIFNGKIHYKWPFSIAMLVHQMVNMFNKHRRVYPSWCSLKHSVMLSNIKRAHAHRVSGMTFLGSSPIFLGCWDSSSSTNLSHRYGIDMDRWNCWIMIVIHK